MSFFQAIIGDLVSIVLFVMVVAGVMKVFQIATDVRESKELLADIKRNTSPAPPARYEPVSSAASGRISAEHLVRAVHSQPVDDILNIEAGAIPVEKPA